LDDDADALPDLVVIDGGKGQLSAAVKGMQAAGIDTGESHTLYAIQ
jgi:excinuclease UvrABC nuclease subunit